LLRPAPIVPLAAFEIELDVPAIAASVGHDDLASAPGMVAHAWVDPTLDGRALQDALRAAIVTRRGYCS
jgi:hypothetical protein